MAARWIEPARRSGPLKAYAREAETRTLDLLEQSLTDRLDWAPHDVIRGRLLAAAPPDVEELLPQLEPRAEELAGLATRRLRERGEREARDLDETLRRQRQRILEELDRHEGQYKQIALAFDEEERGQSAPVEHALLADAPRPVRPRPGAGAGADPGGVRLFCVGGPERSRRSCERHGESYLTRRRRGEEGDGGGSLTGGAIPSA